MNDLIESEFEESYGTLRNSKNFKNHVEYLEIGRILTTIQFNSHILQMRELICQEVN